MSEMRYVAVFTEDDFETLLSEPDYAQARAFANGLSRGARYYAGSLAAYVLPEDEEEMRAEEDAGQTSRAVAAWNEETAK
jgi:hypothetical protein